MKVEQIKFQYKNYKGEIAIREVIPSSIWFGETEYHEGKQWFLKAWDIQKEVDRNFALKDIKFVEEEKTFKPELLGFKIIKETSGKITYIKTPHSITKLKTPISGQWSMYTTFYPSDKDTVRVKYISIPNHKFGLDLLHNLGIIK